MEGGTPYHAEEELLQIYFVIPPRYECDELINMVAEDREVGHLRPNKAGPNQRSLV